MYLSIIFDGDHGVCYKSNTDLSVLVNEKNVTFARYCISQDGYYHFTDNINIYYAYVSDILIAPNYYSVTLKKYYDIGMRMIRINSILE